MKEPYTQLYLHCVWSTWDRLPLVTPEVERQIYASIVAKCAELNCDTLALGGVEDHVHLLVRFPAALPVAKLVGEVKGVSSHLMTHRVDPGAFFKWQRTYGAFTVHEDDVAGVAAYIDNQKAHHATGDLVAEWEKCEEEWAGDG